jgi:DNA-binding NtrC family response regulator
MPEVSVSLLGDEVGHDDEVMAYRHRVALLISGRTAADVQRAAHRIHARQFGDTAAFVTVNARTLPCHSGRLQRHLAEPLAASQGGTLFLSDIEQMPIRAQDVFLEVLAERFPPSVRLISGTTVPLFERVAAGHFAEELFYRLNVIHLMIERSGRTASA